MKADRHSGILHSYRLKMMLYTVLSAGIAALIVITVIYGCAKIKMFSSSDELLNESKSVTDNSLNILQNTRDDFTPDGMKFFGHNFPWLMIIFIVVLSLALFIFIFHMMTRRTTKYIEEITASIQHIAQGDFSAQIPVRYNDEFTVIAESLNIMALDLRLLKDKEATAEETKNELITNVAHDLRTPLTSIIGYLELLNSQCLIEDANGRKYIDIVYNKSKRLQKLIEDLFSFTKLNYGNMPISLGLIDVVKLLEQQIEEFYPSFEDKNLVCEFKTYETNALIMADGELIARAFENLITNAVRYGKNGKIVRISIKKEGNFVKVSMLNYGPVIPKDDLEQIFEKFYRVEQSRQENTGGTGLGLTIVKSIVEKHRGYIEARSSMAGTVFDVYLRLAANANIENFKRDQV